MSSKNFQSKLLGLQRNLLNFAYLLTSNRDDAYDLLQDTTLKALENEDKYVENVNFKGWVFTTMRNTFINNYRKVVRSATIIDQTEDLYHLNLPQESGLDTPEGSVAVNEITAAISEFSDDYRIPFSMHVAGYKYNEIAEKMNPARHREEPYLLRTPTPAEEASGLQVNPYAAAHPAATCQRDTTPMRDEPLPIAVLSPKSQQLIQNTLT